MTSTVPVTTIDPYSRNLGRGKACDACRRRKLRCDGAKPTCSRCLEARQRKIDALRRKHVPEEELRSLTFPPCYTDGDGDITSTDASHSSSADTYTDLSPSTSQTKRSSSGPETPDAGSNKKRHLHREESESGSSKYDVTSTNSDLFFAEILSSQLPMEPSSRSSAPEEMYSNAPPPGLPYATYQSGNVGSCLKVLNQKEQMEASDSLTVTYLISQPDIPLPPRDALQNLIDICYEEHPSTFLFHPGRLRQRLALGPSHLDYPHKAALHIMVALAYSARPELETSPPTCRSGAHYRHTAAARHYIAAAVHNGTKNHSLDVVRASLMLVFKLYGMGDQMESYLASTQAVRFAITINANRDVPSKEELQRQQLQLMLLQPRITDGSIMQVNPRDEIEAEEVRRTMLLTFAVDRVSISATLWPGSLSEEDYTAELPRATLQEFVQTSAENVKDQAWVHRHNSLSLQSPDFFSRPAADTEQFYFKGCVLMGRSAQFIFRLPRFATPNFITSSSRFQQLESWIAALHLESYEVCKKALADIGPKHATIHQNMGQKADSALSSFLLVTSGESHLYKEVVIASSLMPYACTLTLHEPIANLDTESEAICAAATRGVVNVLRLCAVHAESEMQRLDSGLMLIVMLVGRSLIRQLESLYAKYIAMEFASTSDVMANNSSPTNSNDPAQRHKAENRDDLADSNIWKSDEFTEAVSLLQADLEVVLLTLKRFGRKWYMATKLHDSLIKLLQFNPEHRLRGIFCVE